MYVHIQKFNYSFLFNNNSPQQVFKFAKITATRNSDYKEVIRD